MSEEEEQESTKKNQVSTEKNDVDSEKNEVSAEQEMADEWAAALEESGDADNEPAAVEFDKLKDSADPISVEEHARLDSILDIPVTISM